MNHKQLIRAWHKLEEDRKAAGLPPVSLKEIQKTLGKRRIKVSPAGISQYLNGKRFKLEWLNKQVHQGLEVLVRVDFALNTKPLKEEDMLKPVLVKRSVLQYFGLKQNPFEVAQQELFRNDSIEDTEYAIRDCITNKKFIAVVGPVGSGKTSLIHAIEEDLKQDENNFIIRPQVFAPSKINERTLLVAMIRDMSRGQEIVSGNYEARARKLVEYFYNYVPEGRNYIIIIDNAHELEDNALKFLKRIYDVQVKMKSAVSIVLVGQKEFESKLQDPRLSEVAQRLILVKLPSYKKFVQDYIAHRAGKDFIKHLEGDAVAAIEEIDNRYVPLTPLMINNLICRAMVMAHQNKSGKINETIIKLSMVA